MQCTEGPFRFSMQPHIKNRLFVRTFSLDNGKDLTSLKCLHKLITMSQLKYSILQSNELLCADRSANHGLQSQRVIIRRYPSLNICWDIFQTDFFLDFVRPITPIYQKIPILGKLDIDGSIKDYQKNIFLWK